MKQIIRASLCFLFIVLCITGCSDKKKNIDEGKPEESDVSDQLPAWKQYAGDPVHFEWYINFSWFDTIWGENLVSQAITEETGVSVEFLVPAGNASQKLSSMIASDTLPDLITAGWWEKQCEDMIHKDLIYPLNVLAQEYDLYFFEAADAYTVNWYKREDGNIYCYPNSTCNPADMEQYDNVASNLNFMVRKDIYEAIGSPDMTTPEGFTKAVKDAVEMFPTVNGEELIPIGSCEFDSEGCGSFDKYLQDFLAVPYEKDGAYYDRYTDEEYIRWLKIFRELNEDGYLKNDIFLDKRVQMEEKITQGRYFCMIYQNTDIRDAQGVLFRDNPDRIYIAVDGPKNSRGDDPILPSVGMNGWTVTFISKNCKDPERAIAFLTYLISEHGQKMISLGIEGEMYDVIDGVPLIRDEVKAVLNTDRNKYDQMYGADNTYWMLQDNMLQLQWDINPDDPVKQLREWTYPYVSYIGQYEFSIKDDDDAAQLYIRNLNLWGDTLPQLLLAESEHEFDLILNQYIEKRGRIGYERVREVLTRKMTEAKFKLEIE